MEDLKIMAHKQDFRCFLFKLYQVLVIFQLEYFFWDTL